MHATIDGSWGKLMVGRLPKEPQLVGESIASACSRSEAKLRELDMLTDV